MAEYKDVTREEMSRMMQRVDERHERLEVPPAADVRTIAREMERVGLVHVDDPDEKMSVIHATSILSDLLEIRPSFGGPGKVLVFDGLNTEPFAKPDAPKSRMYSGIPYSFMINHRGSIEKLGFMSVEMVKTVDDWYWVSVDCQICSTHPLMGYRTDYEHSAYFRCDQARGVVMMISSPEFTGLLAEYPGNQAGGR